MVDVFKTNVTDDATADQILEQLQNKLPLADINFDLDDCDHILRIDYHDDTRPFVTELLANLGFHCAELE